MKNFLFILLMSCLITSCYWGMDLNDYSESKQNKIFQDEYYWYYNKELFTDADSCYVVGIIKNIYDDKTFAINRQIPICNDTIYVIKKYIAGQSNIFDGVIYIKNKEPFRLITKLQ